MFRLLACSLATSLIATISMACDTALIPTIDVSNSVAPSEYRLQVDGLASALRDPAIVDAMIRQEAAIAVVQWSGEDKQETSIPWVRIRTALDAARLADPAQLLQRAFVLSDTAPAEAVLYSMNLFGQVSDCNNKVIDVSGNGSPNSGSDMRASAIRPNGAGSPSTASR